MLMDSARHCSLSSKFTAPTTLRLTPRSRGRGRTALQCYAFEPNPYEALERAVQVINRIIDMGEKAQGKGHHRRTVIPRPERWVQFGAASSSRLDLLQNISANNPTSLLTPTNAAELLQAYLALPVEDYALLDPKWVRREDSSEDSEADLSESLEDLDERSSSPSSFRLSVPLRDVIGVDLRPELSISAVPDPEHGCVTMVGSRAALGSPGLDKSFKLELVAVLSSSEQPRRGKMPPLPGRPVDRLRQWAARRRARAAAAAAASVSAAQIAELEADEQERAEEGGLSFYSDDETIDTDSVVGINILIPGEKVYVSGGVVDGDDGVSLESDIAPRVGTAAVAAYKGEDGPSLHCRVDITMAVKVPGALRVVPNPLLGYAGSMVLGAVLNGALPNFLNLLSADFGRWVEGGKKRQQEEAAGDLFSFNQRGSYKEEEEEEEEVKEGAGAA